MQRCLVYSASSLLLSEAALIMCYLCRAVKLGGPLCSSPAGVRHLHVEGKNQNRRFARGCPATAIVTQVGWRRQLGRLEDVGCYGCQMNHRDHTHTHAEHRPVHGLFRRKHI
ncbi:hypothetical protein BD413DRAFT_251947 [Trametes elegans]|nr:hypothetical protein BD413DRAFT_251947 [Trametes elegans]